jgi:hypothetical protein
MDIPIAATYELRLHWKSGVLLMKSERLVVVTTNRKMRELDGLSLWVVVV